jgi:hypothetical protein
VCLRQTGEIRAAADSSWRPFTAEQVISVSRIGFAWSARVQSMPLIATHILDCYVDGKGLLEARLCGSLPLARMAGPEISKGELMRYLAELVWAPHAIRYNPHLSWREIDASAVEVSAPNAIGEARVRLIFRNGDIACIEADDRPRAVGRHIVSTRWEGRCWDYRQMDGCRIPTKAAVSWLLEDGPFEYWRGRVTAFRIK